jgi:hypothetical protein
MALGTTGLLVTAAVLAGAAGAGVAVAVGGAARAPSPGPAEDEGRVAALEDRIARQEKDLAALRVRVEESVQARAGAEAPAVAAAESLRDPAGEPPAEGAAPAPAAEDPAERARVERLVREARQRQQAESRKVRLAAFEARLRERFEGADPALALTPDQKEAIVKNILERSEKVQAIFEEARSSGAGPEGMRTAQEKAEAVRQESRQALQALLTADQYQAVERMLEAGGGQRRPGGRVGGTRQGGGRPAPPAGGAPR